jgi:dTDP-4-amino-4,6-dideoxygalactose transaminase
MSSTNPSDIPMADPRADNVALRREILDAIGALIDSGQYILGDEVRRFEQEIAAQVGVEAAVGVGSGTDALVLAMLAAGVGPGDEVIVPSHTAGPSIAAINVVGAVPVFADISRDTYCIDPEKVTACIGPRSKAILAVHLYGHPADLTALRDIARSNGMKLIEDCAQAHGSVYLDRPVGSWGDFGCFSFYPTKNLGALGDGGAITTNEERAALVRKLRTYGWSVPQFSEIAGGRCSRLDELQAAILRVKLAEFDKAIAARRRIAQIYMNELKGLPLALPLEQAGSSHTYHLFVVQSQQRDALRAFLQQHGIATGIHYPYPGHVQPGLAANARIPMPLEVTEAVAPLILSLPLFPQMTDAQIERVVSAVRDFHSTAKAAKSR